MTVDIAIRPDDDERHTIVLEGKEVGTITPGVDDASTPWTIERFHHPPGAESEARCSSLGEAAAILSTDKMKAWMLGQTEKVPDAPPQPRRYTTARTVETTATGAVVAHSLAEAARLALLGRDTDWELDHDLDVPGDGRGSDVVIYDPDSEDEIPARQIAETERMPLTSCARCGADLTIFDEFTANAQTQDEEDTYVHADESRCKYRTVRKEIRICGYLPSTREVEFTDHETGEIGYGRLIPTLARAVNVRDMTGRVIVATGTERPIEWSWHLKGRETGIEIENLLKEDGEEA